MSKEPARIPTNATKGDIVTVYVWVSLISAGSPGHAALAIGDALFPKDGYISFAPEKEGEISGPGKFYDKAHDDARYKGRGVWIGTLKGLDTKAMKTQLQRDLSAPPFYNFRCECSTTVERYLKIGGGDAHSNLWDRNNFLIVTPDDAESFARSIIRNTTQSGSTEIRIKGEGTPFWSR